MGSSKADKKESSPYEVIRGMWEVPYAAQFIILFKKKFDFPDIKIQDLEDALVDSSSVLVADICARLLRFITEDFQILISTFEESLKSLLTKKSSNCSLAQGSSWHCLAPDERVVTLKWLIDHVFEEKEEELMEHLDDHHSPDDLRGICAGQDAFNNLYWYLDDLRLYRENCAKKVNKKDWECVCHTLPEWRSFLKQFRKTSNSHERQLHTYLSQQIFPLVEHQFSQSASNSIKNCSIDNEELILKEKKQMDSMFERNNKVSSAPNKPDSVKPSECNGLILPTSAGGDEVSKVPPLLALQQQHEDLLANGDISEPKAKTAVTKACSNNSNTSISNNNGSAVGDGAAAMTGANNANSNQSKCAMSSEPSSATNNTEFSPSDIKVEPTGRTSESVSATTNGLLTNGNDNSLAVDSLNGTLKTGVESVAVGDGARNNIESKSLESSKVVPTQQALQQTLAPTQQPQLPAPCLSHIAEPKDEKLPVPNINNTNMGPAAGQQQAMPPSVAMGPPAPSATVQPLPSNVLNKTSVSSLDAQYMQQQSQIFVFSTALANEGAEAVMQGHYPSIITYHCDQPGTKVFLEKHPLKVQQFRRQNHAAWINSLSQGKPSKNIRFGHGGCGPNGGLPMMNQNMYGGQCNDPRMPHPSCVGPNGACNPNCWSGGPPGAQRPPICNNSNCCPSWGPGTNQQMHMMPNKRESQAGKPMMNPGMGGPSPRPPMPCGPGDCGHTPGGCHPPPPGNQMMGQAPDGQVPFPAMKVKVPDENLTPQQRQHREEQLATLRRMHEMLFPDQISSPSGGINPQQQTQSSSGPVPACTSAPPVMSQDTAPQIAQAANNFNGNIPPGPPGSCPRMPGPGTQHPTNNNPQMEWQKLEHQFFEDKKRKTPMPSNANNNQFCQQNRSMINNSPNVPLDPSPNGPRMHGPPPPYPQQSPVRTSAPQTSTPTNCINIQQPSPISTMSPASASLSLPSPHSNVPTTSINSPAAPRMTHPSPGSALPPCSNTPHAANSIHNTPLNSPSPALNNPRSVSNPATPSGTAVMTSTSPGLRMQENMSTGPLTPNSSNGQPIAAEGTFGRTLQSYAQSSQQRSAANTGGSTKEPSLMPVPSPQQIQYLNAFDGQELTIQKQPNTSIRNGESNIMSPANMPGTENGPQFPASNPVNAPHQQQGPPAQYCSPIDPSAPRGTPEGMGPRFPMEGASPHFTGLSPQNAEMMQRYPVPGPHQNMTGHDSSGHRMSNPSPHNIPMNGGMNPNIRFMNHGNSQRMSIPAEGMQRCPGPGPDGMQRFTSPTMDPRIPMMESGPRFRAPCPSPHHGGDQMAVPHKYQAMSSPQGAMMDTRFPSPASPCTTSSRMKFPGSVTPTSNANVPPLPAQSSSIPPGALSPHMQSLQKMTASFDMVGTPLSNKVHTEMSAASPFGSNVSNPSSVNSSTTTSCSSAPPDMGQLQGQKLTHFDPLASMAEMSAPSGPPSSTSVAPSSSSQSAIMSGASMNMSSMQFTGPNAGQGTMSSIQSVQQNIDPASPHVMPAASHQMSHNTPGVPQTVNNTYVNATMSIQQLNIQNASASAYNANVQVQPINAHPPMGQHPTNTMYTSPSPHPHSNMSPKPSIASNMPMSGANQRCAHPQHFMPQGQMAPHRGMSPNPMSPAAMGGPMHRQPGNEPRPYNGANVQVKATAPNTIQYLPTRPQRMSTATNRPPSLEFLNRFTAPLSNLDNKVPTQNLQYFPNAPGNNNMGLGQNMNINMNQMMGPPGGMNGTMMEQMDPSQMVHRPPQPMMIRGPGPPQQMLGPSSEQMCVGGVMQPGHGAPTGMPMMNDHSNFGPGPGPGSGPMPNHMMNMQMMPSGPGPQQMFIGGKPVNLMAPDASQHLPPTMGNAQPPMPNNNNYKSNFVGPSTVDPNYAAQFHNFQQQLYATNSRPTAATAGPVHMNNPNVMNSHYYMPK